MNEIINKPMSSLHVTTSKQGLVRALPLHSCTPHPLGTCFQIQPYTEGDISCVKKMPTYGLQCTFSLTVILTH